MSLTERLKQLPEFWKVVPVVVVVFIAGFTTNQAFHVFSTLPDEVAANSAAITRNQGAIEGVANEMRLLRLELRVSNCLELQSQNPALSVQDCLQNSIRESIPPR